MVGHILVAQERLELRQSLAHAVHVRRAAVVVADALEVARRAEQLQYELERALREAEPLRELRFRAGMLQRREQSQTLGAANGLDQRDADPVAHLQRAC